MGVRVDAIESLRNIKVTDKKLPEKQRGLQRHSKGGDVDLGKTLGDSQNRKVPKDLEEIEFKGRKVKEKQTFL